jgi:SPP1 gp7 family putative phage head morphogenesis protein
VTAPVQDQQQDDHTLTEVEAAVVAAIALWLASRLAIRAVLLPGRLVDAMSALGISPRAARAAGKMALSVPLTGRSRYGAPNVPDASSWTWPSTQTAPSMARRMAADEPTMRARYIMNAARRLTTALLDGEFIDGLTAEKRNLVAHVQAGKKRVAAAAKLDAVAAMAPGGMLRWVAILDERTTPDCRVLDGVVFTLDNPPGVPGAQHPACRCSAVPVFAVGSGQAAA